MHRGHRLVKLRGLPFLHPAANLDAGPADPIVELLPAVRRFFVRRTSIAEAEDLTQEVYVHMAKRPQAGPIDNLSGYVFQVATNVLAMKGRRDRVRQAGLHIELTDGSHPVDEESPESILLRRDQLRAVRELIEELPERVRTAFVLHRFEEMTYDAIACQLDVSVSSVEKYIARALKHLAARMQELES